VKLMSATIKERVTEAFRKNPKAMTMMLARQLELPEAEVVRALPDGLATELDIARWEELIRGFEALQQVHVIASNGAVTLEANGQFGNFSTWGEFFNVQTPTLDMHIRFKQLGSVFAVEKPSHMDGVNTLSIQFFDAQGNSAFKVFLTMGGSAPAGERAAAFNALREKFRK
jgi:putative heme iron utilization protein